MTLLPHCLVALILLMPVAMLQSDPGFTPDA